MPSASSTSKIRLSWLRKSSGVSRLLALYSTYCSCLNVGSPRSNATATWVGCSSRSTLISIAVNPYTALVGWPVVVEKFSTGSAKNARYASECPSSSSSLSVTLESYDRPADDVRDAAGRRPTAPAGRPEAGQTGHGSRTGCKRSSVSQSGRHADGYEIVIYSLMNTLRRNCSDKCALPRTRGDGSCPVRSRCGRDERAHDYRTS